MASPDRKGRGSHSPLGSGGGSTLFAMTTAAHDSTGGGRGGTAVSPFGCPDREKQFLPPRGPVAGAGAVPRPNYLRKSSPLFIACCIVLVYAFWSLCFRTFYLFGIEHYDLLKHDLQPAWIPFRWLGSKGVDVVDKQWYYFVVALPPTLPILLLFVWLSRRAKTCSAPVAMPYSPACAAAAAREAAAAVAEAAASSSASSPSSSGSGSFYPPVAVAAALALSQGRYIYFGRNLTPAFAVHLIFGVVIAFGITGPGFLFGLALMLINYGIAHLCHGLSFRACMAIMWMWHITILFVNFHADGYRFAWFGLSFLDGVYAPVMRWGIQYNMSVLRMIAFNNDYWEALADGPARRERAWSKHDRCCVECAVIRDGSRHISPTGGQAESLRCYKCRTECPRPLEEYNLLSYLAFMFYPPLFIAGPMSSFNAYVSHMHYPTRAVTGVAVMRYGLRFLANAVAHAAMMHYCWITALLYSRPPNPDGAAQAVIAAAHNLNNTAAGPIAEGDVGVVAAAFTAVLSSTTATTTMTTTGAPEQQSALLLLTYSQRSVLFLIALAFLWSKFNVFWKFFRFIALLDGYDVPEDMKRCFANTVNIQGFWRDWHASFNLWIVRYMYIPMGGRQRVALSIFPIFFFIAIWHDIELRLLVWALFMSVFMVPEVVITTFFASKNTCVAKVKRRALLYRSMRIGATVFNMLLLILVNLIGFSIGMSGTQEGFSRIFSSITGTFAVATVFFFSCGAIVAIQTRDQEAYEIQVLKLKYDLQSR